MKSLILLLLLSKINIFTFAQPHPKKKISIEVGLGLSGSSFYSATAPHPFFVNGESYDSPSLNPQYGEYKMKIMDGALWKLFPKVTFVYQQNETISFFAGITRKLRGIAFKREKSETSSSPYYSTITNSDTIQRNIKNNYLEFPIGVRYYFKARKWKPFVYGGAYAALLLYQQADFRGAKWSTGTAYPPLRDPYFISVRYLREQPDDGINGTRRMDVGVLAGAGFDGKITDAISLTLQVGMQLGLRKLDRHNNNELFEYGTYPTTYDSRNYYGFSSNSKNLSLEAMIGIRYVFYNK